MISSHLVRNVWLAFTFLIGSAVSAYPQQATATFSGRITDQNTGLGVANVAVVAQGNQKGTRVAVTDAQGSYTLPVGSNTSVRLRAYRTNFIFNPAFIGFAGLGGFPVSGPHTVNFTGAPLPFPIVIFGQPPIVLTEDDSLIAFTVDSLFHKRDPFALVNDNYFGSDKRTRIKLLLVDLDLFSGETLSIVTAQAIDQSQVAHALVVEDLRKVPGVPWMSQLTVMLPGSIASPTDLTVTVTVRGNTSNPTTLRIH